jgi:hypothetical protein
MNLAPVGAVKNINTAADRHCKRAPRKTCVQPFLGVGAGWEKWPTTGLFWVKRKMRQGR